LRRADRGNIAARASADNDEVVGGVGHHFSPSKAPAFAGSHRR
jgi:hypothetical protein